MFKIATGVAIIGALAVFVGIKWYRGGSDNKKNNKPKTQNQKKVFIPGFQDLKQKINKEHPTESQMKQLFIIIVNQAKKDGEKCINQFRNKRRELMNGNFGKYIRFIRDKLLELKDIDVNSKAKVLEEIGMTSEQFDNAALRCYNVFEEAQSQRLQNGSRYLSKQQLSQGIKQQKEYIQKNGDRLVREFKKQIKNWTGEQKQLINEVINIIFSDESFKKFKFDEEEIQFSSIKHKGQLTKQIAELNNMATELMAKIQNQSSENN